MDIFAIRYMEGTTRAHQRFESGWVGSEWFTVSDELLREINEIGTKPSDLGIEDSIAKVTSR